MLRWRFTRDELWHLYSIVFFSKLVIQSYLLCVISRHATNFLPWWLTTHFSTSSRLFLSKPPWSLVGELWKFDDFQESARIVARKIFDKRAIRRGTREWNDDGPVVVYRLEEGGARWTSLGAAQCCFDGVTKDRPAREQTNDRGSENKWQWLSKRERGPFVNAPHYRLLEIFHIRAPHARPPLAFKKNWSSLARARYLKPIPPHDNSPCSPWIIIIRSVKRGEARRWPLVKRESAAVYIAIEVLRVEEFARSHVESAIHRDETTRRVR